MFLFQSLVSLVQSTSSKDSANAIMFWMFGSLSKPEWTDIGIIAIVIVLAAILFTLNLWKLTSLKLGDAKASSLGIDTGKLRRNVLMGISVLTAVAVSFTGTIGFADIGRTTYSPHAGRGISAVLSANICNVWWNDALWCGVCLQNK